MCLLGKIKVGEVRYVLKTVQNRVMHKKEVNFLESVKIAFRSQLCFKYSKHSFSFIVGGYKASFIFS